MSGISAVKRTMYEWKSKGIDLVFSLHMRKLYLDQKLEFDPMTQNVVGQEDFGYFKRCHYESEEEEHHIATNAIVFLINCVNAQFQMPVGYFILQGNSSNL